MNKTKVIALSLVAAGALVMTGCGSSNGSSNPTPAPTNTPTPTPAPTNTPTPTPTPVPDYAKPAPLSVANVTNLIANNGDQAQVANLQGMSDTYDLTAMDVEVTYAWANDIINNVGTKIDCATMVEGGISGSVTLKTEIISSNTYKVNVAFNECKFDIGNNVAPFAEPAQKSGVLQTFADDNVSLETVTTVMNNINENADSGKESSSVASNTSKIPADELFDLARKLFSNSMEENTFETDAVLNDVVTMNGSVHAEVAFSLDNEKWDFNANSLSIAWVTKEGNGNKFFDFNMNGSIGAAVSATKDAVNGTYLTAKVETGGNFNTQFTVDGADQKIDVGSTLDNVSYVMNWKVSDYVQATDDVFAEQETDNGNGYVTNWTINKINGTVKSYSVYQNDHMINRAYQIDPAVQEGVEWKSTFTESGKLGYASKNMNNTFFVGNSNGAFDFSTPSALTLTKFDTLPQGYAANPVATGKLSITGANEDIVDLEFVAAENKIVVELNDASMATIDDANQQMDWMTP